MANIVEFRSVKYVVELTETELDIIKRKLDDTDDFASDESQILDELITTFGSINTKKRS